MEMEYKNNKCCVEDFFYVSSESTEIQIMKRDKLIAAYDGKNSIPEKYNSYVVKNYFYDFKKDILTLYV